MTNHSLGLVLLYKKNGESIDHLLINCEIAMNLWNDFFAKVGVA